MNWLAITFALLAGFCGGVLYQKWQTRRTLTPIFYHNHKFDPIFIQRMIENEDDEEVEINEGWYIKEV